MEQGGDFYERENKTLEGTGCCLSCGAVGVGQHFCSQDRDRGGFLRKEKGKGHNDSCSEVDESRIQKGPGSCFEKTSTAAKKKHWQPRPRKLRLPYSKAFHLCRPRLPQA